ncbi:hypothetical protein VTO73DRAFT_15328 [Trametes versicolor]
MARSKHEAQPLRRSARIALKPMLPPEQPSLCEACWNGPFAAQLGLLHPRGYSYFVWRSQIRQRASSGCPWCQLLVDELFPRLRPNKARPEHRLKITLTLKKVMSFTPIDAQELQVSTSSGKGHLDKILTTSSDNPASPYIVARELILDVGSSRTLSLAKALIDECVHGHERCKHISPSSDVRLPTRLLDCTDLASPRLVSTEGQHGKYVALSYVWGGTQPHKTTDSNISIYSVGIDASLLPQTILDAIYVTHTLGFRYLWVDSLCIIQDSDEDKLHEIGRMHLIYRHAYLTIIAASAERASDGFLQDRPVPPCSASLFHSSALHPASSPEMKIHRTNDLWLKDKRGWCLQELLMSSRALIFASTTLRFRCQHTTLNVGNSLYWTPQARHPPGKARDVRLPDIVLHPAPLPIQLGSNEWHKAHIEWCNVVMEYSKRTLGQATDKLIACGALADAFHRVLGCDYLAGLWRDTLFEHLLWDHNVRDSSHVKDRPAADRAPSWSWAAVDGEINFPSRWSSPGVRQVLAEVINCEVVLKDPELLFGEVTGGSLVLRATLMPCECPGDADHVDEGNTVGEHERLIGLNADSYVDHLPDILIERDSDWLLPFWWKVDGRHDHPAGGGLIVTLANPASGSETENRKVYRRIGMFILYAEGSRLLKTYYTLAEEAQVEII